jgi:predicted aspartyl protease
MPLTSIEFPLFRKRTPFGLISDPKIPVGIRIKGRYRGYRFLLDTGADFALVPRRLAEEVGLEWEALPETRVIGVEGRGVPARLGRLPLRIGPVELKVRCLFVDSPAAPFVLGRADFLEHFRLVIDPRRQRIILEEAP